jgi:hypothetical protein
MERGLAHNIMEVQTRARQGIKERMPSKQEISASELNAIIEDHVVIMREETSAFKDIFRVLEKSQEDMQMAPLLLTYILNDLVFLKTGV